MSTATAHFDRLLEPISDCFTPEVAQRISELRADAAIQAEIDALASKANAGTLTEAERLDYAAYVEAVDLISILQAKARSVLSRSQRAS